jgi:hypothetical protein
MNSTFLTNTTQQPLASSSELSLGLMPYNTTTQQHNNTTMLLPNQTEGCSEPAINKAAPTIVPKTRRTRTITPVSEDEKCTSFVVSGKNKGGRCSKKATKGSLCTMHHKKIEPIQSTLSEEFVKSDDDVSTAYVSTTPRASIVEFSL